jgi:hypothetical protein
MNAETLLSLEINIDTTRLCDNALLGRDVHRRDPAMPVLSGRFSFLLCCRRRPWRSNIALCGPAFSL